MCTRIMVSKILERIWVISMNDVLYAICCVYMDIMTNRIPIPSTIIANELKISVYQARKELKKLKEAGLVVSTIYCDINQFGNFILRGYTITEKAKDTKEYKTAYEESEKVMKECFEIGILKDEA